MASKETTTAMILNPDSLWNLPIGQRRDKWDYDIKKILETSYGKMLNLVYQNWYTKFTI